MSRKTWTAGLTALCIAALAAPARAQEASAEKTPVASVNVDVLSAYVWRGLTFNDGRAGRAASLGTGLQCVG